MTESRTHYLKIYPEYFELVKKGLKTFELRKNDRDFNEGDILCLSEWDDKLEQYTSKKLFCKITYVLKGPSFGLSKGYCIMSIKVDLSINTTINENWRRLWCTKCDVDLIKKGIALDCPEDGIFYECPSCNYRVVIFKKGGQRI